MEVFAVIVAFASVIVYLIISSRAWNQRKNVALIEPNDFEVAQAKLQAQASLDRFRRLMEQNPESYSSVKAALPTAAVDEFEHIWVESLVPGSPETPWQGKLANDPIDLPGLKLGSDVSFPESAIEDWIFETSEDSIEGGFSLAAMRKN